MEKRQTEDTVTITLDADEANGLARVLLEGYDAVVAKADEYMLRGISALAKVMHEDALVGERVWWAIAELAYRGSYDDDWGLEDD